MRTVLKWLYEGPLCHGSCCSTDRFAIFPPSRGQYQKPATKYTWAFKGLPYQSFRVYVDAIETTCGLLVIEGAQFCFFRSTDQQTNGFVCLFVCFVLRSGWGIQSPCSYTRRTLSLRKGKCVLLSCPSSLFMVVLLVLYLLLLFLCCGCPYSSPLRVAHIVSHWFLAYYSGHTEAIKSMPSRFAIRDHSVCSTRRMLTVSGASIDVSC